MRRIAVLVSLTLLSTSLFAAEPSERRPGPAARFENAQHMILRVNGPLTEADRQELAAEGVRVQQPIVGGAFIARVIDAGTAVRDARIASIEPLTSDRKIFGSAWREAASGRGWSELSIFFHDDVSFDQAREAVLAAGGAMNDPMATRFAPMRRITAKFDSSMLEAIAGDERVFAVAGPFRYRVRSDNAPSALLSHVTELYDAPYGLTGAGVNVSLFELGTAQTTHPEFGGRLTSFAIGGSPGDNAHATHVSGTIGAAGLRADAKGMAPEANIYQFCVATGSNQCTNDWLADKDQALAPLGIVADNNSWGYVLGWTSEDLPVWTEGDAYWGAYDLLFTAPLDQISIERNVLFVHSAGNDGDDPGFAEWGEHHHVDNNGDTIKTTTFCYSQNLSGTDCPVPHCNGGCETTHHHPQTPFDTIGVTAAGKNVVTVGAAMSNNGSPIISGFSSRGPAKDGRVKPDVVTQGVGVLSTVPTNSYANMQGTSMASPVVTGIAALLVEQWRKSFAGANPSAAQLRALILASADDLGNKGPDYTFGFGLADAKGAVDLILADEAQGRRIRNLSVAQGQQQEIPVVVSTPQDLRVTLSWPDPAIPALPESDEIAAKALVNDLDVKVIDPNGVAHFPYVLDKNAYEAPATRGINTIDNAEVVEIDGATPGRYTVVVNGRSVPEGPQDAIVISSARVVRPCIDHQESNDTPAQAWGNLVPNQTTDAGLCSQNDRDYFKFAVTKIGPVSVDVTTGDTAVRVTLTSNLVTPATIDVPANSTGTLSTVYAVGVSPVPPAAVTLEFEPIGTIGDEPTYFFTPHFGQTAGPRRRASGH